ncbi:hypothetical protein [Halomonas sp. OfavH-34-E]|uniref:hypothetical protein n=1 Tax=Halomonas sp. OfavH-34-E TaxID=2954491 RepID=UPI0020977436|nr:hypothetical protein [Halomonas sp. OfavH-34-E]MCO7217707.1 hypothetical protein [Halomonas sp. OfavH-34-E]
MHPRLRKLVKTRNFNSAFCQIIFVTVFFGIVGLIFHLQEGKDSATNLITLANNTLKFGAWFFLGYGTLQALGRKIEFENIENAVNQADISSQYLSFDVQTNAEETKISEDKNTVYKEKINDLVKIEKDDQAIFKMYMVGIVLFLITSLVDIVLPAFKN